MEIKATAPHLADATDGFRNSGAWPDTVLDHVALASGANPGQPALVDRRERFDYQDLESSIGDCASELRRHVQEQDSVVVVAANDCRSAIAVHALRRIGAVCILISDHAEEKEIAQALERTSPRIAMAPRRMIDQLSDRHPSVRWMSTSTEGVDGASREPFVSSTSAPNLPGVVVFTSGSTSRPKGVVHSTNTLQVAAANYIEAAGLSASDVFILVSPLSSITGVLQALVMAPMLGGCVVFEDQWDDAGTFDLLLNEQATFYGGPTSFCVVSWRRPNGATCRQCPSEPSPSEERNSTRIFSGEPRSYSKSVSCELMVPQRPHSARRRPTRRIWRTASSWTAYPTGG